MSLMLAALLLPEAGNMELFRRGEDAFRAGVAKRAKGDQNDRGEAEFLEAARLWEAVRSHGVDTAPLYRNLGNAYFLAGDLPHAILDYRLGLRRGPGDTELRLGLRQARSRVEFAEGATLGRPIDEHSPDWPVGLSLGWIFATGVVLHAAGWACLTRWYVVRRTRLLVAGVVLMAVGLALGWAVYRRQEAGVEPPVVVIARDGVMLRKGNGSAFPPWSDVPLNRGVEAEWMGIRDGWVQIRLSGGEVGWVSAAEVVVGDDPEASL